MIDYLHFNFAKLKYLHMKLIVPGLNRAKKLNKYY